MEKIKQTSTYQNTKNQKALLSATNAIITHVPTGQDALPAYIKYTLEYLGYPFTHAVVNEAFEALNESGLAEKTVDNSLVSFKLK